MVRRQLQFCELNLALFQRQFTQVDAVEEQQVEGHVEQVVSVSVAESVLERLKIAEPFFVHGDDFTIENRLLPFEPLTSRDKLGELLRPIEMIASLEPNFLSIDTAEHAVAVEFYLMEPVVAVGRGLDQRRQLQFDGPRNRPFFFRASARCFEHALLSTSL